MVQHLNTAANLPAETVLIKSPDGGKTGTKFRLQFFAGHVFFTAIAAVYLKADNTTDELPISGVPEKMDTVENLENYLNHQNTIFPLYRIVE